MNDYLYEILEAKYSNYIAPLSMFFYMILLASSVAGQKLISISKFVISAGSLIFPITYMIIACITEVYGMKRAKRIILCGALCNLFVSAYLFLVTKIPPAAFWTNQESFAKITNITASILLISTSAYLVSEYVNAYTISKLKILLKGRWLLIRAITSSSIAIVIDAIFMLPIILYNSPTKITDIFISLILVKIIYEIFLLPFLWISVEFLKRKEGIYTKNFTPFSCISYMKNSIIEN